MLKSFDLKNRVTSRKNVVLRKLNNARTNRLFKVFVTNMKTGDVVEFEYKSKKAAHIRFVQCCNELDYKYTDIKSMNASIAGGVGHDFRLELIEIQ